MEKNPIIRPNFIDYGKVICEFLVISLHYVYYLHLEIGDNIPTMLGSIFALFTMPFFFMISGILYKDRDWSEYFSKAKQRLIIPYVLMATVSLLIGITISSFREGHFLWGSLRHNIMGIVTASDFFGKGSNQYSGPLWFCYSMVIIQFLMVLSTKKKWLGICFLILGIICLYLGNILPLRIDTALVGFIFFYIGYEFKGILRQIEDLPILYRIGMILLGIVVVSAIYFLDYSGDQIQKISINAARFGKYPILLVISGLTGSLSLLAISTFLQKYKLNFVNKLSTGMLAIIGFQHIIYMPLEGIITSYSLLSVFLTSTFVMFISYLLIIIINKWCPIMIGNRK